jgi:uncharacterized protein
MRNVALTNSVRQMCLVFAGFAVAIVLLESDGLASWATHLEIGPLRAAAVPATAAIAKALHPLHIDALRQHALNDLARVGWTDDAAMLAANSNVAMPAAVTAGDTKSTASCAAPNPPALSAHLAAKPPMAAHTFVPGALGSETSLVAAVPRITELAPLPLLDAGKTRVVALAGDSMMAVGLSATLMRQAAGDKNLRIVKVFRSGTGLARPEVFNWMDEYPAMLGAETPDVVIVAIGANDGQGFVVDGKVLAYGTDNWRKVYQERLASYLAMVGASGARVVWVGLPPMRVPAYNERIETINRIAYTVVSQSPDATWWNPVSYVGDDHGNFREFETQADGKTMRLRATDGIHLSDEGAGLLTSVLMKWLDPPPALPALASVSEEATPTPALAIRPRRHVRRTAKS